MKTARIGTILPWGGDGNEGFTASNIPKGWKVCDGQIADANDYPLLFSEIGNTYGGTATGDFPNYTGQFFFPKLTNKCMMDLESAHLDDVKYQYGQGNVKDIVVDAVGTKFGDYIDGYGTTSVIKTSWSANADIDFGLSDPDLKLSGKITNMGISDPDFTATVTTLNRKLGINHTPGHSHPGQFSSAQSSFYGPQIWKPASLTISGSTTHPNCSVISSTNHTCDLNPSVGQAPDWSNGRTLTAYYGSDQHEDTLPTGDKFHNYVNDAGKDYWSEVPAPDWHDGTPTRNSPQATSQSVDFVSTNAFSTNFNYDPVKTHAEPAWSGLFPRPFIFGNRRNYYGHSKGTFNNLIDNPEDPSDFFSVSGIQVGVGVSEILLPVGTDIRSSHGTAPDNWYQYDKIHPWMMVDGDCFAKGTYISSIERQGNDDSDWVYTIKLSAATTNTTSGQFTAIFRQGTFGTSLSNFGDNNPNSSAFTSHGHGTFDIQMGRGSLNPPATFPLNDISIGSVYPESLNDALNIIVDTAQPNLTIVFLIKAY